MFEDGSKVRVAKGSMTGMHGIVAATLQSGEVNVFLETLSGYASVPTTFLPTWIESIED